MENGIAGMKKYGFSELHDEVLDYCRWHYLSCPFGCTQDGAPNCYHHTVNLECQPAKDINKLKKMKGKIT